MCESGALRDVRARDHPGTVPRPKGAVLMMKELRDLPTGVIGFEVAGELRAED